MSEDESLKIWQKDAADYGDNACLMWIALTPETHENNDVLDTKETELLSNQTFYDFIDIFSFRRKESAALPFDLERAKAGDEFEVFDGNPETGWSCAKYEGHYSTDNSVIVGRISDNYRMRVYFGDLRMQYPPKVNHD